MRLSLIWLSLVCALILYGCSKSSSKLDDKSSMTGSKEGMILIKPGVLNEQKIKAFYLDRTEVTVEAYTRCVEAEECVLPENTQHNNYYKKHHKDHPINGLNFEMARAYCAWAGKRLPTQREWQWAAQGREEARIYPWGNTEASCEYTVFHNINKIGAKSFITKGRGCGKEETSPVGSRPKGASRDGLLDMAGNVFEWTSTPRDGRHVMCGGSWTSYSDQDPIKTTFSYAAKSSRRHIGYGARCAGTP